MIHTYSPCKTIDRTFILSFSLPNTIEIRQEYKIYKRKIERYRNPIEIALRMGKIIKEGNITKAELARIIGISRERVTQYTNLLKLEPMIKKEILEKK